MNRGTLRTLLGKRLQDTVDDQFDDTALNDLINVGIGLLQNEILKVNPLAFVSIDTFASVASQPYYEVPANIYHEVELGIADTSAPEAYRPLTKVPWRARTREAGSNEVYARLGQYWWIQPTPTASTAAYFRLIWHYALSLSDDTTEPRIHSSLHTCIVDYAVLEALGETYEGADRVIQRLDKKLIAIPAIYAMDPIPMSIGAGPSFRTT